MTKEAMELALEALRMPCEFWNKTQFIKVTEAIKALEEALKQKENNFNCKTHPDAPHGFVRNASHSEDRYVCECEFWEPPEQDEPVAYINVEQRKLEWAKYTSWETPTVANLPKIPLYTRLQQRCDECGNGGGYALYCLPCVEKFVGKGKEWVGLTDEDIEDCYIEELYLFAVALEAKLKEKNI